MRIYSTNIISYPEYFSVFFKICRIYYEIKYLGTFNHDLCFFLNISWRIFSATITICSLLLRCFKLSEGARCYILQHNFSFWLFWNINYDPALVIISFSLMKTNMSACFQCSFIFVTFLARFKNDTIRISSIFFLLKL